MLSLIHAPAQFAHAAADSIGQRPWPLIGVRRRHHVAQHVPDQADHRLDRALAHCDRAERRMDRTATGPCVALTCAITGRRAVAQGGESVTDSAISRQPRSRSIRAAGRDQLAQDGWRYHQPVRDDFHSPPSSSGSSRAASLVSHFRQQAFSQLRGRSWRCKQADDQLRLLR